MKLSVSASLLLVVFTTHLRAQPQEIELVAPHAHVRVFNQSDLMPPNGLTIEAWVFWDGALAAFSNGANVVSKGSSGLVPYYIAVDDFQQAIELNIRTTGGSFGLPGSVPAALNAWTHVAGSWDGTTMRLYVNGQLTDSQARSGTLLTNSLDLEIGKGWGGRIDEVRIWDHARSAGEIAADRFIQIDHAPGLIACWHFNGSFDDETGGHVPTAAGLVSLVPATSPVDPLQLVAPAISPLGAALDFTLRGANPYAPYFLDNSLAGTTLGTPLIAPLTGVFPLDGPLLNLTFGPLVPGIFENYLGYMDPLGEAQATFNVPPFLHLSGAELSSAFLFLTSLNPMVLGAISPVVKTTLVDPGPRIDAVLPAAGPVYGGWSCAIRGQFFAPGCSVLFGSQPAGNVVVQSPTLITCTTPLSVSGTGPVSVTVIDPDGASAVALGAYLYTPALQVLTISPSHAAPGSPVTLGGLGFQAGSTVTVGGLPAQVQSLTVTTIVFTMPAGVGCHAAVVVTTPDGQTDAVVANPGPVITATVGAAGPTSGGTQFQILGQGFVPGVTVSVGGQPAAIVSQSTGLLVVAVPPGSPGSAAVLVMNPDGCAAATNFVYF